MATILIVLKASLLLGAALLGARLLRSAAAGARHAVWSVTFAALLALPLLGAAIPSLHIPIPAPWTDAAVRAIPALQAPPEQEVPALKAGGRADMPGLQPAAHIDAPRDTVEAAAGMPARVAAGWSAWTIVRGVWIAGTLAAAGALLLSLVRVRRLARTAREVSDPAWRDAAHELGAQLGLSRPPRLLVNSGVRTPMAGGVWHPLIFLPEDAASWTPERRDIVLAHELSHLARRDPIRHLAARLAVACYWFHPLAWVAARESSLAREQACDEAVLALGIRPSEYARVLLDFADTMTPPHRAAAALPMVERSLLEARLMAILDPQTPPSRRWHPSIPAAGAALLALTLAAAQPAARSIDVRTPVPVPGTSARPAPATDLAPVAEAAGVTPADQGLRSGTCWYSDSRRGLTADTRETGTHIERNGTSGGGDWIIQQRFGDVRVCMLAQGLASDRNDGPTGWVTRVPLAIVETVRGASTVHLEIRRQGGTAQTTWRVNGTERPFDATAQAWRDAVLAVLEQSWAISTLRGDEASLRGDIASLRGDEASLRGDIASLQGDVASMRGDQASIRGEESSLRGEISSIQGHVSSLRGQISSEHGSISSLQASRYGQSDAERSKANQEIREHEKEIDRLEQEIVRYAAAAKIADVEKEIRALNADGKIAEIEERIRTFNERGKAADIEKRIQALNVDKKAADIERRIQDLDVERRTRQMEDRLDEALKRLQQALAGIR